jgi:hypothetical protein
MTKNTQSLFYVDKMLPYDPAKMLPPALLFVNVQYRESE